MNIQGFNPLQSQFEDFCFCQWVCRLSAFGFSSYGELVRWRIGFPVSVHVMCSDERRIRWWVRRIFFRILSSSAIISGKNVRHTPLASLLSSSLLCCTQLTCSPMHTFRLFSLVWCSPAPLFYIIAFFSLCLHLFSSRTPYSCDPLSILQLDMAACASAVGAAAVVCVTPVAIHTQSQTSVSVSKGLTLAASPSKRFSSKLVTKKKSRVTMRYWCCFVVVFFPLPFWVVPPQWHLGDRWWVFYVHCLFCCSWMGVMWGRKIGDALLLL